MAPSFITNSFEEIQFVKFDSFFHLFNIRYIYFYMISAVLFLSIIIYFYLFHPMRHTLLRMCLNLIGNKTE